MLDIMSGGRLVAGFPVGTSMDTTFSYGQVPITLREKHTEAHDLIMRAWSERQPFVFNGKYNKLRYVNIWPRPLQQPHPPVWVPGCRGHISSCIGAGCAIMPTARDGSRGKPGCLPDALPRTLDPPGMEVPET